MSPISLRLDVTEIKRVELAELDLRNGTRDLSGDERSASSRRLVVETTTTSQTIERSD
jgi:hypothetical protein